MPDMTKPPPILPVRSFRVLSGRPHLGWWDLRLEADEQHLAFAASHVLDPALPMIDWVDRVAKGESAILHFDLEGTILHLRAEPHDDDLIWLQAGFASSITASPSNELVALVSRKALLQAFVSALAGLIASVDQAGAEWTDPLYPSDDYWPTLKAKFAASKAAEQLRIWKTESIAVSEAITPRQTSRAEVAKGLAALGLADEA